MKLKCNYVNYIKNTIFFRRLIALYIFCIRSPAFRLVEWTHPPPSDLCTHSETVAQSLWPEKYSPFACCYGSMTPTWTIFCPLFAPCSLKNAFFARFWAHLSYAEDKNTGFFMGQDTAFLRLKASAASKNAASTLITPRYFARYCP